MLFRASIVSNMSKAAEGVFAINKPPSISSGQVIRDLQVNFIPSTTFASLLQSESAQRGKHRRRNPPLKIGHGGTLDPIATGVMIVGVGRSGTKHLGDFLSCTKTYEAIVTFGVATDSYDRVGKVVAKGSTEHITRAKVEEALEEFKGDTMQVPPIFSALKMNGMKLYEYARAGKELPKKIEARPAKVYNLELMEWWDAGEHSFKQPIEEAPEEEKVAAERLMEAVDDAEKTGPNGEQEGGEAASESMTKRAREPSPNKGKTKRPRSDVDIANRLGPSSLIEREVNDQRTTTGDPATQFPAAKLKMTVGSGFYVRALCHDLGKVLGSYGIMNELVRTRQADFELGKNVFEYDDLEQGEDVWGPKIRASLAEWSQKQASASIASKSERRSRSPVAKSKERYKSPSSKTGTEGAKIEIDPETQAA